MLRRTVMAREGATDDVLMALVADGDPDAFALLYRRYHGVATTTAVRMRLGQALAEEVVQEAFLSCWRARRRFDRRRGSVRGWLLALVRNRAIDALRRGAAHSWEGFEDAWAVGGAHAGSGAWAVGGVHRAGAALDPAAAHDARELLGALAELPPDQGQAIALVYYGGYTHAEVAMLLDTPLGTVKGRVRRGLCKLADAIEAPA